MINILAQLDLFERNTSSYRRFSFFQPLFLFLSTSVSLQCTISQLFSCCQWEQTTIIEKETNLYDDCSQKQKVSRFIVVAAAATQQQHQEE